MNIEHLMFDECVAKFKNDLSKTYKIKSELSAVDPGSRYFSIHLSSGRQMFFWFYDDCTSFQLKDTCAVVLAEIWFEVDRDFWISEPIKAHGIINFSNIESENLPAILHKEFVQDQVIFNCILNIFKSWDSQSKKLNMCTFHDLTFKGDK